jgi:hypothetical protein
VLTSTLHPKQLWIDRSRREPDDLRGYVSDPDERGADTIAGCVVLDTRPERARGGFGPNHFIIAPAGLVDRERLIDRDRRSYHPLLLIIRMKLAGTCLRRGTCSLVLLHGVTYRLIRASVCKGALFFVMAEFKLSSVPRKLSVCRGQRRAVSNLKALA